MARNIDCYEGNKGNPILNSIEYRKIEPELIVLAEQEKQTDLMMPDQSIRLNFPAAPQIEHLSGVFPATVLPQI
jgi:hypothetical protein